ncbi:D-sedoheptulose 7-phosphate isomerase [Geotalea uraniireducens]|uniref:Phosphoheptose isomerase n=1 Tax=Geotalea uraniireducens (strain Rf4) TaxID=351605 RepID=GMHA_GEOUR|nr:D-sedoheptulose 7-phosphate isomerase [Geotalea uraniireducens]A5G5G9.1 RecName: Full=Phosphoheptose isomerase; AltName: Full=Sedoheptulose 7-phosphate isomerase [Geotalea uraniireducens Rf4]ABQ27037.1 phosphoheptose isomerase [Geotalea uraniireducens Rf4]
MIDEIKAQLDSHQKVMESVKGELAPKIAAVADLLVDALGNGKKLLVMGNGGSAADAQHFAAEIVGRFKMERRGLPAIALTTDTSILTAIGNDYGFEQIFRRQIEALACEGDVVVGISTSGTSKNVHGALLLADQVGCRTIGLLGKDGGTIREIVDVDLTVSCDDTPRVQEGHITIIHIICDLLEKRLFG